MPLKIFAYAILVTILLGISFQSKGEKSNSKICYFVVWNGVQESANNSWSGRKMTILLDTSEFTEENLRCLASELFNKYPNPQILHAGIYSDIGQLPTGIATHGPDDPSFDKSPYGGIYRIGENEIIRYAVPPSRSWNTIVLKGKD